MIIMMRLTGIIIVIMIIMMRLTAIIINNNDNVTWFIAVLSNEVTFTLGKFLLFKNAIVKKQ